MRGPLSILGEQFTFLVDCLILSYKCRVKREAMQKHIQMAVNERQKVRQIQLRMHFDGRFHYPWIVVLFQQLQDILKKRKAEVEEMFESIKKQAEEERRKVREHF